MTNQSQHPTPNTQHPTIGIDASRALVAQRTGTEQYSASLLEALTQLPKAQRYNIVLYANSRSEGEAREKLGFPLPPNWSVRAMPFPRLWTHARLSWEMATKSPQALFVPSHVVPLWHPRRTIVTIHDLGYLQYPQAHTSFSRLYLHLSTLFSVRAAKRVIAISEATRNDLVALYRVPAHKIRVVYHGRDPLFAPVRDEERLRMVRARYGVSGPYCLHVGTLQPRKNLGLLVEVWSLLKERMEKPPQLLLAGKRGWLYSSLLEEVQARDLGDLIRFADYVEREDLPALYSGALALLFPSLYEGFGLPALEAMACGTPVMASDVTSLPEVVDEGGLLLDPHDPQSWAGTLGRLMSAPSLQEELSRKGQRRAQQFTWERCARETLAVLTGQAPTQ